MSHGAAGAGAELGRAVFNLDTDLSGFQQGLQVARNVAQQESSSIAQAMRTGEESVSGSSEHMAESLRKVVEGGERFIETLSEITRVAIGFSVATTAIGILDQLGESMREAAEKARELGEETSKVQAITGASTEQASAQIALWERFGVSAGQVERGYTQLSRAIQGFTEAGSNDAGAAALEKLGVAIEDANGKSRTLIQIQDDVIEKLRDVQDPAERNTLSITLLGRSYASLYSLLTEGKQKLAEYREEAEKNAMTKEQQDSLHQWEMAIKSTEEAWSHLGVVMATWLAGPAESFSKWLTGVVQQLSELPGKIQTSQNAVGGFLQQWQQANDNLFSTARRPDSLQSTITGQSMEGPLPEEGKFQAPRAPITTREQANARGFVFAAPPEGVPEPTPAGEGGGGELEKPGPTAAEVLEARKVIGEQMIKQVQEEIDATNEKYDREIEVAKNAYEHELDAAKTKHEGVLANLEAEKKAVEERYNASVEAARNAEQRELDAAKVTHQQVLDNIDEEKRAAEQQYQGDRVDLQINKQGELDTAQSTRDKAIDDEQRRQQEVQRARQQADNDRKLAEQQADHDAQQAHQKRLQEIQDEGNARQKQISQQMDAARDAASAETRQIEDDQAAFSQAHDARLRAIQQEQQAAEDQHQANRQALENEQQAARDEHDQRTKDFAAQEDATRREHDQRTRDIRDEQDAEHRANQDRLNAIAAQEDAEQRSIRSRLDGLNAEKQAADEARQARSDQQNIANAQTRLTQDMSAGGDPTKVLSDQQALQNAVADMQARSQDEQRQAEQNALQQQLQEIKTAADAEKSAIQDTARRRDDAYKAQLQELDDAQQHELDTIHDERDAEQTAYDQRIREIHNRLQAEDDRYQAVLKQIQSERDAENQAASAFAEAQRKRRNEVQDTLKQRLDSLKTQQDQEKVATELATRDEQKRYADEQFNITRTRELAAQKLATQRAAEDQQSKDAIKAVNDQYTNTQKQIAETYDNPKTGLFVKLDQAYKQTLQSLTDRTTEENKHYSNVQQQIKDTYENTDPSKGAMGLIPTLKKAYDETKKNLDLRTTEENKHYEQVQKDIKDTYFNNDDPDNPKGVIPAAEKAKKDIIKHLTEEVTQWQAWSKDVVSEVDKVTQAYDRLTEAANRAAEAARKVGQGGGGSSSNKGGTGAGGPPAAGNAAGTGADQLPAGQVGPFKSEGAVAWAQSHLGAPYSGPLSDVGGGRHGDPGWDCSSFVSDAYKSIGVSIPAFTDAIADAVPNTVPLSQAHRGDIVLFRYSDSSQPGVKYPHTGIFLDSTHVLDDRYPVGSGVHGMSLGHNEVAEIHRVPGYASGGLITDPTMLVSLKTGKPSGLMAEAGPEYIIPKDQINSAQKMADGGLVTRPTLLVDPNSLQPKGLMGEAGPEWVIPAKDGAGAPGANFHFDVRGPSMNDVSRTIRREFERSTWLHGGFRR